VAGKKVLGIAWKEAGERIINSRSQAVSQLNQKPRGNVHPWPLVRQVGIRSDSNHARTQMRRTTEADLAMNCVHSFHKMD
jgi:hypothetical protein